MTNIIIKKLIFIEGCEWFKADIGNFHATITKAKSNIYGNNGYYVNIHTLPTGMACYRDSIEECQNLVMSEYQGYIKRIIADLELSQVNKWKVELITEFDNYIISLVEALNQYLEEPINKYAYTIIVPKEEK